jgi:PAS domain S-box-containing protein
MPHGHCYFWKPEIVWTNAISDTIIALAYFTIPLSLLHIVRSRTDFKYYRLLILFAFFILGCGATHVMDVINIWTPYYRIDSSLRVITAIASIGTALMLARLTPQIILIPNTNIFEKLNTDLEQQVKQLQESQYFIAKITEASPNTIYVFDLTEHKTIYINREKLLNIEELPEHQRKAERVKSFFEKAHPEDLPRIKEYLESFTDVDTNEIRTIEYRLKNNKNQWKWYQSRDAVFKRNDTGAVTQIIGVAIDITDRKLSEQELQSAYEGLIDTHEELIRKEDELRRLNLELEAKVRERTRELAASEERYKTFIRQSSEGIYRFESDPDVPVYLHEDTDQQIYKFYQSAILAECNNVMARMYGFDSAEEITGSKLPAFLSSEDPHTMEYFRNFIRNGYRIHQAETLEKDKYGNEKYFLNNIVGIIEDDRLVRIWGTQRDITEWKLAEQAKELAKEELALTNTQLRKINADLDNFIYTASHDLKAPVSNIEGLVNTLADTLREKKNIDDELEVILSMVDASIKKFQETILDLTEISKAQKNIGGEMTEINVANVIDDVIFSISNQIEETNAVIETNIEVCNNIRFSKNNFRSIIYNLVNNAIKYRSPDRNPHIIISCMQNPDNYVLEIQDNGLGISEEHKEKIFGMFKRLHHHVEGTGVGLYLVKRMIENAGGKIDVESKEGIGSTFRVYIKK